MLRLALQRILRVKDNSSRAHTQRKYVKSTDRFFPSWIERGDERIFGDTCSKEHVGVNFKIQGHSGLFNLGSTTNIPFIFISVCAFGAYSLVFHLCNKWGPHSSSIPPTLSSYPSDIYFNKTWKLPFEMASKWREGLSPRPFSSWVSTNYSEYSSRSEYWSGTCYLCHRSLSILGKAMHMVKTACGHHHPWRFHRRLAATFPLFLSERITHCFCDGAPHEVVG